MGWINVIFWGLGLGMGLLLSRLGNRSNLSSAPLSSPEATQLREQLQNAELAHRMATDISQFKAGFLAKTSHELRSPLNSVISLHQLILADLSDDPAEEREFVAQANAAAMKMLGRLDELIQVSKVESGSIPLQIQPTPIANLIEEVRRLAYLQAQNRNLRLEVEPPDAEVHVLADPRWLRQVLLSLLTVPIALMQEGTIRLTAQVQPEAQQVQIFVEDQRPAPIDEPASPDPESAGLDLTISQILIERMQGRLEVLPSIQSPQTRICCTLPLMPPDK